MNLFLPAFRTRQRQQHRTWTLAQTPTQSLVSSRSYSHSRLLPHSAISFVSLSCEDALAAH